MFVWIIKKLLCVEGNQEWMCLGDKHLCRAV